MLRKRKNLIISLAAVITALCITGSTRAQTPAVSSSPASRDTPGNYEITSSVELGVRGLSVNGDHEKYRSDLNYRPGFRVFDSSFLIEDRTGGAKLFDSALVMASGWGADPTGSFRLNMEKTGIYKFDSNVRRVRYFNNLKNHVVNWSQVVPTRSEHALNTLHHFGDMDLTVFPQADFRLRFGYSFNKTNGPGFATLRFPISGSDEFQVDSDVDSRSDDFRAGVEGKLLGFNLGLNYGHRTFRDRTRLSSNFLNVGNNPLPTNPILTFLNRQYRIDGTTDFGHFFVQRTFAKKFDFTGRFIYSEARSHVNDEDQRTGRVSTTGNIIPFGQVIAGAETKRPQSRGDLGLTYRATEAFRISNTFTFDQFNIGGTSDFFDLLRVFTPAGVPQADQVSNLLSWRITHYRRLSNLLEFDYQVNRRFGFNIGWRYTHRNVGLNGFDRNRVTGAVTIAAGFPEDEENTTNSLIVGSKFKPTNNWSVYVDLERGQADNVFTRLANNDYFNFRVRSIANIKQFSVNLSFITRDSDNPGSSIPLTNAGGFPATETIANTKIRMFASSIDWTPRADLTLSAGYNYTFQNTKADVILPIGAPVRTTTAWFLGSSEYYVRDSYFFFDVSARPIKRLSLYASYRINDDAGQGDRVMTRPQDIISSYPMRYQTPEARIAIKLTRNIDWNLGYQYYSYRETPYFNPFASTSPTSTILIPQRIPAQNYTAHMPYTSLRFYFGRAAEDR